MNAVKFASFLIILLLAFSAKAQDSLKTLSAGQVMEIVKQFHPMAKQADIFVDKAKADVTSARGLFDPVLKNEMAEKTFDGTNYYSYNRPELIIPTWFGMEVSAGLENLSGSRTPPEETQGKTSYVGISIPLAKNLLIDKRRAVLQTAKILEDASAVEKRTILNTLLLDAMNSYWNWAKQYQIYNILTDAVKVNEKRVGFTKTAFRLGDRPAIDTTEALAQLQNFELLKSQALLDFQNAGLELSLFMWTGNAQPYTLTLDIVPADDIQLKNIAAAQLPELNNLLQDALENHPDLLIYNYKLDVLSVEKRLKFQDLLPTVNFRYNQLGKGYDVPQIGPFFENNYQYGLSLAIPLRLSQGRGEYRKAKLKITETQLQQREKQWQVENKVKSYFNELMALKSQVALQEKALKNYQLLQRGEEIRFQAGESSLFLINSRENKTLEALQKLQDLKVKYYKTENSLQWAAGRLIPY
ncbi:TolC family protein [Daejeonella oryzae]|uniref:TolC family protein n=1 Tax=Daejeonella oryzae TaxID=1122943 RepID=UPI00040F2229|nr:TolC family protein [Daejeonella oryzae]